MSIQNIWIRLSQRPKSANRLTTAASTETALHWWWRADMDVTGWKWNGYCEGKYWKKLWFTEKLGWQQRWRLHTQTDPKSNIQMVNTFLCLVRQTHAITIPCLHINYNLYYWSKLILPWKSFFPTYFTLKSSSNKHSHTVWLGEFCRWKVFIWTLSCSGVLIFTEWAFSATELLLLINNKKTYAMYL